MKPVAHTDQKTHSLSRTPLLLLLFSSLLTLLFMLGTLLFADALWIARHLHIALEAFSLAFALGLGGSLLLDLEILRNKWK